MASSTALCCVPVVFSVQIWNWNQKPKFSVRTHLLLCDLDLLARSSCWLPFNLIRESFWVFSGWNSLITSMYSLTIKFFLPWPWELLKVIQTVFIRNATIYLPMDPNLAIVLPIVSAKLSFFVLGQEHFAVTRAVIGSCSDQENQNLPMSWPLKVTC